MGGFDIEKEKEELTKNLSATIRKIRKVEANARDLRSAQGGGLIVNWILTDTHEVLTILEHVMERIARWELEPPEPKTS